MRVAPPHGLASLCSDPGSIFLNNVMTGTGGGKVHCTPCRLLTGLNGGAHVRVVTLGPKAQKIIRPYMKRELAAYVFSPKEVDLVPEWTPHQLRHTVLTRARKEFGLEASSTFGGHRNMNVTEIYAEKNMALADRVAQRLG